MRRKRRRMRLIKEEEQLMAASLLRLPSESFPAFRQGGDV